MLKNWKWVTVSTATAVLFSCSGFIMGCASAPSTRSPAATVAREPAPACTNFSGLYRGQCIHQFTEDGAKTKPVDVWMKIWQFKGDRAELKEEPGQYCSLLGIWQWTGDSPKTISVYEKIDLQVNTSTHTTREVRTALGGTVPNFDTTRTTTSAWSADHKQLIMTRVENGLEWDGRTYSNTEVTTLTTDGTKLHWGGVATGRYGVGTECDFVRQE